MISRAEAGAEFARRILPLARRWRAEADRAVADLGLSDETGWLLLHVGRLGDGVPVCRYTRAISYAMYGVIDFMYVQPGVKPRFTSSDMPQPESPDVSPGW